MAWFRLTNNDDIFSGTDFNDSIYARRGNDVIFGKGGNDYIVGSRGNDILYGYMSEDIILLQDDSGNGPVTIDFSDADTLKGGKDDDRLYGDLGQVTLSFESVLNPNSAGSVVGSSNNVYSYQFGDDLLKGGSGNLDFLFGDAEYSYVQFLHKGAISNGGAAENNNNVVTKNYGDDRFYGGDGVDLIIGDVDVDFVYFDKMGSITSGGGHAENSYNTVTVNFGADDLAGQDGDDGLVGDVENASAYYYSRAGITIGGNDVANSLTESNIINYHFGVDELDGSVGNDTLHGDAGGVNISYRNMDTITANGQAMATSLISNNEVYYHFAGGELIDGGSGIGSAMGDVRATNASHVNLASVDASDDAQVIKDISGNTVVYNFGHGDVVRMGDSGNTLYGDATDIDVSFSSNASLTANDNASVTAKVTANQLTYNFGDDDIATEGGFNNLRGDAHTLDIVYFDMSQISTTGLGTVTTGITDNVVTFNFGDDVMQGGDSGNSLVGDVATINDRYTNFESISAGSNVISHGIEGNIINMTFGDDTLIGGNGFDHLYGDYSSFTTTESVMSGNSIGANSKNIIFGNDTLTGGAGQDTFHFVVEDGVNSRGEGHDVVTDLSAVDNDSLAFHGVANINELDAILTSVTEVGADVVLTFDDSSVVTKDSAPSTITLEGIATGSISSVYDLDADYTFMFYA